MRDFLKYVLLATVVAAAPQLQERDSGDNDDDDCSMVWVTIYVDASTTSMTQSPLPTTSSTSAVLGNGVDTNVINAVNKVELPPRSSGSVTSAAPSTIASSAPSASNSNTDSGSTMATNPTANGTSTLNIPNRPDGSAPIPINGDHLSAPVAQDPVPQGAATYIPPTPGVFNNTDFAAWMQKQKDAKIASKWMKVAPGAYRYALGTLMPSGTDANTVVGENIAIGFTAGGWTLDLRGVTFYIDITPENQNQRPGDMIYINQSEGFTILGGTIWIDQGEQWTQARVTSMSDADSEGNQIATMEVEQGYNVSAWNAAGPRNQGCVDDSDPNHFTRPGCNFWYVSKYDFSNLESKRTFTASVTSRAGIQKGYVVTMEVVINSYTTISTENNGNFHVKGFTSNGAVASIGLNGKVAPIFEDVYYVNPPPRPGYAPRVEGPALSWGNIGGPAYNPPGQPLAEMPGSVWQTSGCQKDLQSASNGTAPN